jgi:nitroimidazol reductase NimA-like FMN-containing flavoprotein (pyridoxamine 5'-phosphate oxidase superfamily)
MRGKKGEVMTKTMRRADRAITDIETKQILQAGEYGILSTVSVEGQPYGVPVSYAYTGEIIYFHCAVEGHKLENLSSNNKVSFCVVGKTQVLPDKFATNYESVIVFGKTFEVTDEEKHTGLVEILKKYSPDFMEKGERYIKGDGPKAKVYKIVIESMTGKARRK